MDAKGGEFEPGTKIIFWPHSGSANQQFKLVHHGDAYASINSVTHPHLVCDIKDGDIDKGTKIILYGYTGHGNQLWKAHFRGIDHHGHRQFSLHSKGNEYYCLDVK